MSDFDLRRLDVNLVVALQALLEEESVSGAARRLAVSQPAASRSLQKLRRHFGDQLLVRERGGSALTPFAVSLRPSVREVIRGLADVFASASRFEASTSERDFVVSASDFIVAVLGRRLVRRVAVEAPGCSVRFRPMPLPGVRVWAEELTRVDVIIGPRGMEPPGETVELFDETWCCVVDPELAAERDDWSTEALGELDWVAAELHPGVLPGIEQLRSRGINARLAATTFSFSAVPFVVRGTRLVGLLHRRLADELAPAAGVSVLPIPGAMSGTKMFAFYDSTRAHDPATEWFLDVVAQEAREL